MIKKVATNRYLAIVLSATWYLILFPGRVHVDSEYQLGLLRAGETTSQWTGIWFRYLQVLTINGRTIVLATFLCAVLTFFTVQKIVSIICREKTVGYLTLNLLYITPLIGYSSVTLNHDIVSSCGTLLTFITLFVEEKRSKKRIIFLVFQISLALTSFIGLIGIVVIFFIFLTKHRTRHASTSVTIFLSIILVCSLNIIAIQRPPLSVVLLPIIADVKCIAQSNNSVITERDWAVLRKIQNEKSWREIESCSSANIALNQEFKNEAIGQEFIEAYIRIAQQNSLKIVQAHILRSSSAIPAPFLIPQSPVYALSEGTSQLGMQQQNGLLLTSRSLHGDTGIPVIKQLEPVVMLVATFVNFFSHIIGWGGLMILVLFLAPAAKGIERKKLLVVLLSMHSFLFLWSPVNDNRYLLTTNLVAWILISQFISKSVLRKGSPVQNIE
jgi:hypothetical protein